MQLFFKEEINIYRKMFSRESKKSVSGMEILNEFVSTKSGFCFGIEQFFPHVIHWCKCFVKHFDRFERSTIPPRTRPTSTKSSGRFDCYPFFAKFCKHSTRMWKCLCHQLTRRFSMKCWLHTARTPSVCAWKIGLPIYPRIKLATNSLVSFPTFWTATQNCASSRITDGKWTFYNEQWDLQSCLLFEIEQIIVEFITSISKKYECFCWFFKEIDFFRTFNILRNPLNDFKDFLESAFEGVPDYGYIFALELNQKFFRAIRIDSEVSWLVCCYSSNRE